MRTKHLMLQIFYLVLTIFVGLLLSFIAHFKPYVFLPGARKRLLLAEASTEVCWTTLLEDAAIFLSLNQDKMKWCWELVWGCGTLDSLARKGQEGSPAVKWPTIEKQAFGSFSHLAWLPPELYVVGDWTRYPPISKKLSLTLLSEKRIYSHIPSSLLLSIYRWNNHPYQILWNT